MNKLNKLFVAAMLLMLIPMKQWAQIAANNNNIEINLNTITNADYRYCLLSAIANDDHISYLIDEENSSVLLSPTEELNYLQFQTYYNELKSNADSEFEAYSHANKETQGTTFTLWKESLPQDLFVLLFRQMLIENPNNRDGNQTCVNSDPFCTTDIITFHVDANPGNVCEPGPDYGCMSSFTQRPPFWFHMKIAVAGTFTIRITNSNNNDLDFCAWGPFTDPIAPCTSQLTSDKIIDCDSPYNSVQECTIPASSQVGQYYIMVITKYSSGATDISFSKVPSSGPGETDCGILPGIANNDGPYCVGETINLTVNAQDGATYSWSGPNGYSSTQQNPNRPNCTLDMAGTYTCTTTVGTQSTTATTEVEVFPQPTANFDFTTVCRGTSTQFTSTSTTNPPGQSITSYQWDFGDGQTSTQQNPSHQFHSPGNHQVTLTVSCGDGLCTDEITKSVTVYSQPTADAGPDQTIGYGGTAQLNGAGGPGTYDFHWDPANMVINPNAQSTQTVSLIQDQTYTLTVTNPQGNCVSTDQVTIHISGSAMTVTANASPSSICSGENTQLQVNAGGGTGNFTYSWTPTTGLNNPNIYNPIANPTQTTTYTCHVNDGQTSQDVTVTVTVHHAGTSEETIYTCPGETIVWHDQNYSNEGDYDFHTETQFGCDSTITLHLRHYPTYDETIISEAICPGETYTFYGTTYNHSCQVPYTDHTIHGCDSIVILDLMVWPEYEIIPKEVSLCPEQLPYHFYGEDYYSNTDVTAFDTDIHGCDSAVRLILTVSDYYMPEMHTAYVCSLPYSWEIRDANSTLITTKIINEGGYYCDTLPTSTCEGIFQLDLHYQPTPETIVENIIACDSYPWPRTGQIYTESGEYYHYVPLDPFPCQQEYKLELTINTQSLLPDQTISGRCDAVPVSWFGQDTVFIVETDYTFTGLTDEGCYREQTYHIENMKYTPAPSDINGADNSYIIFGDTIAVVTNTEFFSFHYDFNVAETNPACKWNSCIWSISKLSWALEFDTIPTPPLVPGVDPYYSSCTVYVADRTDDYVVLTATIFNDCGSEERKFFLKSSFLDVDENNEAIANIDIIPNPNNGQMHINFENMEGQTSIKVFDMTGSQIDAFETSGNARYSYDYTMKRYSEGIYLFVISNGNRLFTKKVVVIH